MSQIAALPSSPSIPNLPTTAPELSPQELFDRAADMTGSYYRGDPLAAGASPEEMVMGAIATFGDNVNISDHERGVLLARVAEMKNDGVISPDEANRFTNEVERLTTGQRNYMP
jgi:hypothetical protein